MKKYPSINDYAEAVLNPEGRFRTLSDIKAIASPGVPVSYTLNQDRVNFRVLRHGMEYMLSCKLAPRPTDDREEIAIKMAADLASPILAPCEYLRGEIYVFDDTGAGRYHDLIATEIPAGIPLYRHLAKLAAGNKNSRETFLRNYLLFAGEMAANEAFSHNNLNPTNVFVCNDGQTRLTDYRLLSIPGDGLSDNDSLFLTVTALIARALASNPELFRGCGEEFFSSTEIMKNRIREIFPGSEVLSLQQILEDTPLKTIHPAAAGDTRQTDYEFSGKQHEGLSSVVSEGKFGYAAANGRVAIPMQYDWGGDFEEGLALVRRGGEMGLIDKGGREILPIEYEDISWSADNGVILACRDGKWRFYDRGGNPVSDDTFDNVGEFSRGLTWVMRRGKYGFANRNARMVIPAIYDDVTSFNDEGYASVEVAGRRFAIDMKGKTI